jgi:hypothetical protein
LRFLHQEEFRVGKQELYLARIAYEIVRTQSSKPETIHFKNYFFDDTKHAPEIPPESKDPREHVKRSKAVWGSVIQALKANSKKEPQRKPALRKPERRIATRKKK